jgi:hypothetical protein
MRTAIEVKRRFTLFFIPLIPLGTRYVNKCGVCGLATKGAPLQPQDKFKTMAAKP